MSFARPTLLKDLDTDRVDGVDHPATRRKFVMFKSERPKYVDRYSLGVVYSADGKPDAHGDIMTPRDLELAAWKALGKRVGIGLMHQKGTGGAGRVVESYIYRGPDWKLKTPYGDEQTIKAGDWVMGVIWDEVAWQAIMDGRIRGYSLQGQARLADPDELSKSEPTKGVEKMEGIFRSIIFGDVREYPIEQQNETVDDRLRHSDDPDFVAYNERLNATLEEWAGKIEDGTRAPEYAADSFPDGDESRQRSSRTSLGYPEGGYRMELEDAETGDIETEDEHFPGDREVYSPRSAGARFPDPNNRVAGHIRKRGGSVSFVDVIFGK